MLGNLKRLINRVMNKFNKMHIGVQVVTLVAIALGIYNLISKKNFISVNLLDALKVREGLVNKASSLTYYSMDGCPYCEKFDKIWGNVQSKVKSDTCIKTCRKIDSKESEAGENGVSSFPTIMLCDENNQKVLEYSGERNADKIVEFCNENCKAYSI